MRSKINIGVFVFLALMLYNDWAGAQTYFKVLADPHLFFNQKTTYFPNGDLLIGDSSLESLNNGGTDGRVFLTRRDPCGNVIWSYAYDLPDGYLEFKDFKINQAEEIFVYGSFYKGLQERIFLLKVDGRNGENGDYKIFHPGAVDHFSYSLDLRGSLLMIYGVLLDFNTQKQGFFAVFNENLTFISAKKISPFESSGTALITEDMGFLGRSWKTLIKLDPDGELEWSTALDAGPNTPPIGGPLEVSDGYILEVHRGGQSFFYKVNKEGQLLWQSELFSSTEFGAAMSLLSDGNVLCTYSYPDGATSLLCQLTLTPDGTISNQRRLSLGSTLNTGNIYQSINNEQYISIAGNVDPSALQSADIADYFLQFSLNNSSGNCLLWEGFQETTPNNIAVTLSSADLSINAFDMVLEQSIRPDTSSFSLVLTEMCEEPIPPDLMEQDTILPCGEDWVVSLPTANFVWSDGSPSNSRVISLPGTYKARSRSCTNPVVIQYTLEKENCGCQVYLPTAFSPNDDGINDQLEFFSDCTFDEIEFSVFSRWGSQVYHGTTPGQFWDGTFHQKKMPAGVYVAVIRYKWTDFDGNEQEGKLFQEVTLLF